VSRFWRCCTVAVQRSIGPKTRTPRSRCQADRDVVKSDFGSAYGIAQSTFAVVRRRPCCAQNAVNVFVSYHRIPPLFVDFAISFAINDGERRTRCEGFRTLFRIAALPLLSRFYCYAICTKRWKRTWLRLIHLNGVSERGNSHRFLLMDKLIAIA
jgi:hypothetical protein